MGIVSISVLYKYGWFDSFFRKNEVSPRIMTPRMDRLAQCFLDDLDILGNIKLNDEGLFSTEDVIRIHRILYKHSMQSKELRKYIQKNKKKML